MRLGTAAHKVILLGAIAVGGSWCVGYVGMSLAYSIRHLLKHIAMLLIESEQ